MKRIRIKAYCLLLIMLCNILAPIPGWALSGGNKAPEFESFQPFGLDNMVDPATGDFSYNIPLMNVGFHGINLFYQAGITMDQEATMVGLGWNINSGMIDRNVRGIPADFNGDEIVKKMSTKPYTTIGFNPGVGLEIIGADNIGVNLNASLGVYNNSYDGMGFEYNIAPSISAGKKNEGMLTAGFGLSGSTDGGNSLSPNISYSTKYNAEKMRNTGFKFGMGMSINSRGGLKSMSLSATHKVMEKIAIIPSNLAASISFSKPSFTPDYEFPRSNKSYTVSGSVGLATSPAYVEGTFSGYFTKQEIARKVVPLKSYGMLYMENKTRDGLQDFHRSGDLPQSEDVPNLAVPMLDFDSYSIAGPGLSGSMQLFRGDLGLVHDPVMETPSNDISLGVEAGAGLWAHLGADIVTNFSKEKVNIWTNGNQLHGPLSFKSTSSNQKVFEKAYFKEVDDMSIEVPQNNELLNQIKGLDPIRATLTKASGLEHTIIGTVKSEADNSTNHSMASISGKRNERRKRTNSIAYKTFKEARLYGFSKYLGKFESLLNDNIAKDHHIAEIIVENQDGYKYVYGIPVYNLSQKEETFSVNGTSLDLESKNTGLVIFDAVGDDRDNGIKNSKGKDNYYTCNETPAYVSTYLLTAIVSKDYQDLTGNGPSPDDYGDYVRFDYEKMNNYNYKTPTSSSNQPMASLSTGFRTVTDDEKGHIIYGERQQYRPESIKNKVEIAKYSYYDTLARKDGWGELINGVQNCSDCKPISALKSITKYALNDYNQNLQNAEKLKSVHFEYDYSLCEGIYNSSTSNGGKLTLKKLYILNGESSKGRFSPYEFNYAFNKDYSPKAMNRYGGYQPRNVRLTTDGDLVEEDLSTVEFPYVPQWSRSWQDSFASAWNLNYIKLPSGGEIHVKYEADDYAYVQDKHAMQMVEIAGFSKSESSPLSDTISNYSYINFEIKDSIINKMLFDAGSDISQKKDIIKEYYLRDILNENLYFKVLGKLKPAEIVGNSIQSNPIFEYVPGWAKIEDFGIRNMGTRTLGYLKLKEVCLEDRKLYDCFFKISPIKKALMQALRLNLPGYLAGTEANVSENEDESGVLDAVLALSGLVTQFSQFVNGVNNWMLEENYSNEITLDKSFIRLYAPSRAKISGSHRVKSIVMNDNFNTMTSNVHKDGIYGKQYEYTISQNILGKDREISSGVAAYEPSVGGEENPFYHAISYDESLLLAPDNTRYQEEPMMEDYFPGPQIVYRKVTTRDLYSPSGNYNPTSNNNDIQLYENTGYSTNEFYTYKEFPIITKSTDKIMGDPYKLPDVLEIFNIVSKTYMTFSQGYFIHNPMMHGKPKASYVFNSSGVVISGQESYYKQKANGELDDMASTLVNDGTGINIMQGRLGLDYMFFGDTREHISELKTYGAAGNTDVIPAGIIPFPLPSIWPKYADIKKRFRSIVLVKSIRQQGILYKTVKINGTSRITTEHLLWDAETCQPIVSQTFNEFDDPVYQVNLPAHLAYKGMGLAYQNINATFTSVNAVNGLVSNNASFIATAQEGDHIIFHTKNVDPTNFWVLRKNANSVYLIDEHGCPATFSNESLRIDDSGYSNQAGAAIASYITRKNPIVGNRLVIDEAKEIIDANATTYKDKWRTNRTKICNTTCQCSNIITYKEMPKDIFLTLAKLYGINEGVGELDQNTYRPPIRFNSCNSYIYTYKYLVAESKFLLTFGNNDCNCFIEYKFQNTLPTFSSIVDIQFKSDNIQSIDCRAGRGSVDATFKYLTYDSDEIQTFNTPLIINTSCFNLFDCIGSNNSCADADSTIVNPFLKNIKGNWRPEKSYVFQTDRKSTNNIRVDGPYITKPDNYNNTFTNFWQEAGGQYVATPGKWTWTTENTLVSPFGNELEAKDPLNRYSTELYGYNNQKVTSVAANARYHDVAYYGAEVPLQNGVDIYGLATGVDRSCLPAYHVNILDGKRRKYSENIKPNSGEYYMQFLSGKMNVLNFNTSSVTEIECDPNNQGPYKMTDCDCIKQFKPTQNKKYLISAWLYAPCLQDDACSNKPYIEVALSGGGSAATFKIEEYGPVIEGWRKVSGTFDINSQQQGKISIKNSIAEIYMDDLRIHPYHATMKTYNYDLKTLRFTFEHDDNNFFTRYDYAKDGTLQRVSKQTERGIQTLQESTFGQQKTN